MELARHHHPVPCAHRLRALRRERDRKQHRNQRAPHQVDSNVYRDPHSPLRRFATGGSAAPPLPFEQHDARCHDLNLRQKMALTDTIIRQHPYVECLFAFDNPQITCHWRIKTVINRWNWKTFNQSLEKLPAEEERWIKLIHEQTAFYPYFCAIAYYRCRGDVVNSIMELTL